jgi:hypothetical protein
VLNKISEEAVASIFRAEVIEAGSSDKLVITYETS